MLKLILLNWPLISAIAVWTFGAYLVAKQFRKDRGSPLRFESIGLAVALIPFFLVLGVFVHDLNIHSNNGRPWSPWNELVLDTWASGDKEDLFASIPLENNHLSFAMKHTRRGRHLIELWIPEVKKDGEEVKSALKMKCVFYDKNRKKVGFCETQDWHGGVWQDKTCFLGPKGLRGGSTTCIGVYSVPKNAPPDLELTAVVDLTGDVAAFLKEYPGTQLVIEKDFDK